MPRLGFALAAGAVTALAVLCSDLLAGRATSNDHLRATAARASAWSERAADAVTRHLDERRHDIELLAALPDVVHAARVAAAEAKRRGLQGRPVAVLERELDASRALSKDPRLIAMLAAWRDAFGFTELSFSERDGYSVLGTERTPDFVQSDEDWWQRAFADGFAETTPQYDQSGAVCVEIAVRISDPATHMPMGVIKGTLPLKPLSELTMTGAPHGASVEIVDAARRIVVSPDSARLFREAADSVPPLAQRASAREFDGPRRGVAAAAPAHSGRWWVVTRLVDDADELGAPWAPYESAALAGGVVVILLIAAFGVAERRGGTR
jgi:hypothetical protein